MNEINSSNEIDHTYFWKLVNRRKRKNSNIHPIKLENGTILTDPTDIIEAWKCYFEKLYTPVEDEKFDENFRKYVERKVCEYDIDSNLYYDDIMGTGFSISEIKKAVSELKNKKAPGWDNVSAEHVKYGGDLLHRCLLRIFNIITEKEFIPTHFKIGLLVPIPKGDKDKSDQDNYRGLTLLPVISKIYEKCISNRFKIWLQNNNILDEVQGSGQKFCSSIHTGWLTKEAICETVEQGGTVYIGLLDTRKAFDTVWIDGLFYKLYKLGIRGKAWRILKGLYKGFLCQIKAAGLLSDQFCALQGIHQGAPLSMQNYCVNNNELLEILQNCLYGIKIDDIPLNCVAYADDVALIARCKNDLQMMVDIAYNYSNKWRFHYNAKKCVILVIGNKDSISIKMGRHTIDNVKYEKHLGVLLSESVSSEVEFIKKRISSCKLICNGIRSIGSYKVPISPIVATKLYKTICIPKLCYGAEVMDIGRESLDLMESYHSTCAKQFIGVPIQCSNPGSVGTIGWKSIEATIDIMRMLFLWKILLLDTLSIYKRVILRRFFKIVHKGHGKGPTNNAIGTFKKYGLFDILTESIETGEFMPYKGFRKHIISIVTNTDIKRWKITCSLYKSLSLLNYGNINQYFPNGWLVFAHKKPFATAKVRCIMNILLNTYRLGEHLCTLCQGHYYNTAQHIILECEGVCVKKDILWERIIEQCPKRLAIELSNMSPNVKTKFLLNAMNCVYTDEWYNIYLPMCNYIHTVYMNHYNQSLTCN